MRRQVTKVRYPRGYLSRNFILCLGDSEENSYRLSSRTIEKGQS